MIDTLPVVMVDHNRGVLDPEQHGGVRLGHLVAELAGVATPIGGHQLTAADALLPGELERRQDGVALVRRGYLFRGGDLVDLALPGRDLDPVLEPGDSGLGLPGGAARHDEPGVARPLHDRRLQTGHYLGSLVDIEMRRGHCPLAQLVDRPAEVLSRRVERRKVDGKLGPARKRLGVGALLPP